MSVSVCVCVNITAGCVHVCAGECCINVRRETQFDSIRFASIRGESTGRMRTYTCGVSVYAWMYACTGGMHAWHSLTLLPSNGFMRIGIGVEVREISNASGDAANTKNDPMHNM